MDAPRWPRMAMAGGKRATTFVQAVFRGLLRLPARNCSGPQEPWRERETVEIHAQRRPAEVGFPHSAHSARKTLGREHPGEVDGPRAADTAEGNR